MEQEPESPKKFEEITPSFGVMKLFEQIRETEEKLAADNFQAFQDFVGVLTEFRYQSEQILSIAPQATKSLDSGFVDLRNFFKVRLDFWEAISTGSPIESSEIGVGIRGMSMTETLPPGSAPIFFEKLSKQNQFP